VVQSGKKPDHFVLNPSAYTELRRHQNVENVAELENVWRGIPVQVKSNSQRSPSVALVTKEAIR